MSCYGNVALMAVDLMRQNAGISPINAWDTAASSVFPTSKSSQEKSCPRSTFLSLCENGLVRHAPTGLYTKSKMNKQYALAAIELLKRDPMLANDESQLWESVLSGATKAPNHQMAVVTALWLKNLIVS